MERYLIDTNTVSDYFSASFSISGIEFRDAAIDVIPNISVITQIELLCWKTDKAIAQQVRDFIADSNVLNISAEAIDECVQLRTTKRIKTPDAIIAATALAYGYTLITNNEKDFVNIKGLRTRNPKKL